MFRLEARLMRTGVSSLLVPLVPLCPARVPRPERDTEVIGKRAFSLVFDRVPRFSSKIEFLWPNRDMIGAFKGLSRTLLVPRKGHEPACPGPDHTPLIRELLSSLVTHHSLLLS